jgi:hypothetical protein
MNAAGLVERETVDNEQKQAVAARASTAPSRRPPAALA